MSDLVHRLKLWQHRTAGTLCIEAADEIVRLTAELASARQDAERLDWLESEMTRETIALKNAGVHMPASLFRRNVPITRAAIDAAIGEKA